MKETIRHRWQQSIRIDVREVVSDVDRSHVGNGSCGLVDENSVSVKSWGYMDQLNDYQPLKDSAEWSYVNGGTE
jgi:hypothetical protein